MRGRFLADGGPGTRAAGRTVAALLGALGLLAFSSVAEAQYVRATASSFSTSSATFTDVPGGSLSFAPASLTDVWVILLSGRVRSTWTTSDEIAAEVRYLVNGTQRGLVSIRNHGVNPGGSFAHFDRVTGTTAARTVTVQLRDGKATATLENLQIVAFRLPAGADFQFAETIGVQAVPAFAWGVMQDLTFTPAAAGDYLVMALSSGRENPSVSTLGVRLQDPTGSFWPDDDLPADPRRGQFENGRSGWPPFFLARVQNLAATPRTYQIQAQGDASGAEIRDTRIMAFRTAVFDAFQSVQDTVMTTTTSTTPVVKSTLTTAAPPAARDHIVIQSLLLDADSAGPTDERRAGFERNDGVVASYRLVTTNNEFESSYAFFDAVTASSAMTLENTFSTSSAAYSIEGKESVIHVLRLASASCCGLQTAEGAGTLTVTAPSSFEMVFNTLRGGGIDDFFDLAEDPTRVYDLAGRDSLNLWGLFHTSMEAPAGTLYTTGTNSSGAKLDLLEATATRVKVRQESFFQRVLPATAILPGVKGIGDYSVYGQRLAVRWNRRTTALVPDQDDHALEITAHREAAGVLNPMGLYRENGSSFPALATEAFVLAQREVAGSPGARTDFLGIQYANWPAADSLTASLTGAYFSWRDTTDNQALAAGLNEKWHFLVYYQPTSFLDNNDTAVTSRSADYRGPSAVTAGPGTQWQDADEGTGGAGDFFNEAEAAYLFDLDPATGLAFDLDGSGTTRYAPFFKIRGWRSLVAPTAITVEGVPKARHVDYKADVKPVGRAHFAQDLLWYSTIENPAALTTPDVGSGGSSLGITFVPARYGSGLDFNVANSYLTFPTTDFDKARGAVEFWVQPYYPSTDGAEHNLAGFRAGPNDEWVLRKAADNSLNFIITANGSTSQLTVSTADYAWRANDWVHVRMEWDESAPLATQQRLLLNRSEPVHTDPVVDYVAANLSVATTFRVGSYRNGAPDAAGLYDEVYSFGGSASTPAALARGGLTTDATEYLADPGRNYTLSFTGVDATRRGEYLYVGSDSKFRGLNVGLSTNGASAMAAGALVWQYWSGTGWANLELVAGFNDTTNDFRRPGNLYWSGDPAGWAPYSVSGGPDLYYVRAHLPTGASYSTPPVERLITTDILLFHYCGDVMAAEQTFSFAPPVPTAVELMSFAAVPSDSAVTLEWRTGSELDNLGFHVHRGLSAEGPWARLTSSLIPGLGSSPLGQAYSWLDSGLVNGTRYYYRLEDVDTASRSTFHGPVWAVPGTVPSPPEDDGEGDGGGDGTERGKPGSTSCPSWVLAAAPDVPSRVCTRHGDPEAVSLQILARDSSSATLELRTGGFWALRDAAGEVRVFIPGLELPADPRGPALPLRRALVDAVVGKQVHLVSAEAFDLISFPGLRPSAIGAVEMAIGQDGTVRPSRRSLTAPALWRGLLPREVARLSGTVFQGERKSAVVEITPVRFSASRRELVLAGRVVVKLAFTGVAEGESGTGSRGRAVPGKRALFREALAQLHTSRRGLHAVSYGALFPSRPRGFSALFLRLQRQGEAVPFHVAPSGGVFGPGSVLYFWADRTASSTEYSSEVAYELVRGTGVRMGVASGTPAGAPVASTSTGFASFETNRIYQPGLLEAPDLWLWDAVVSGAARTQGFTLSGADTASGEAARLRVHLQGGSESGITADHHVRLSVNGGLVGEATFSGKRPYPLELSVPASLLREGANELSVVNVGDTGVYSLVFLDRFEVSYPQVSTARQGVFEGEWGESGTVEVTGVSGPPVILRDSGLAGPEGSAVKWVTGFQTAPGLVRFQAEAGHRYVVVSPEGLLSPRVGRVPVSTLKEATNRADYVVIAPRELLEAAQPLLERRRSQGLVSRAVSFEEIASEFGHGQPSAEAIRAFLKYAYHSWQGPSPRYVILLGDATYDPRHFLSTSWASPLPALWARTSYLWTVSDPALAAVNGEDGLPDLSIGRLPATTREQAEALITKLLAWEDSGQGLSGSAVLVADTPDMAGDFEADVEDIRAGFLGDRATTTLKVRELGTATRPAILGAFDEGASLMSYVGHGGTAVWSSANVLNSWDTPSLLAQSRQPLLLTLNCLNGYFVAPNFDSLSEALLKAEGRGAIAAFSPSGLNLDGPAHQYHRAVMAEVTSGAHERLGDAILAAQAEYGQTGLMPELLTVYQLLGDPALKIR